MFCHLYYFEKIKGAVLNLQGCKFFYFLLLTLTLVSLTLYTLVSLTLSLNFIPYQPKRLTDLEHIHKELFLLLHEFLHELLALALLALS